MAGIMTSPISGNGPIDPSQNANQQKPPEPFNLEKSTPTKPKKIDTKLHPLAKWFMNHWGWTSAQALAAEKQFLKTVMHQCQQILNKYKNIYKKLDPRNETN